ncbi:hypothetical protein LCGC14_1275670 [marine sediment metagenome]|uniref:Right handed beta helix domain-containing protein n=2 Tax=marine sediment metagenome TaxID=412755 RepID=A0A0F9NDH1_9ZZZZ
MKSDIKKRKFLVILGIIFVLLTINQYNFSKNESNYDDNREIRDETNLKKPKSSEFWDENDVSSIHISADNWSATDLPWIQNQTGTWSDPHIIENVTIDGTGKTYGIFIENSNDYFTIRNVSIYNVGTGGTWDAALKLVSSSNGIIINSNFSNNEQGILLRASSNITISNNIASENTESGVYLASNSDYNVVSENYISENTNFGIYVSGNCDNNLIMKNTVLLNN